jgi:AcrR family transcriptional regulator
MKARRATSRDIPTQVKNRELVERRRSQIVDAAVEMFLQKGFHKTTTRQIAQAAGISNGLLYEYIATKEDILYLVCDAIHAEMQRRRQRCLDPYRPTARSSPGGCDPAIFSGLPPHGRSHSADLPGDPIAAAKVAQNRFRE